MWIKEERREKKTMQRLTDLAQRAFEKSKYEDL